MAAKKTKKKEPKALARTVLFEKVTALCEILDTIPGPQRNVIRTLLSHLYEGSCHEYSR